MSYFWKLSAMVDLFDFSSMAQTQVLQTTSPTLLEIELGIGLGVGVPLVFITLVVVVVVYSRRKKLYQFQSRPRSSTLTSDLLHSSPKNATDLPKKAVDKDVPYGICLPKKIVDMPAHTREIIVNTVRSFPDMWRKIASLIWPHITNAKLNLHQDKNIDWVLDELSVSGFRILDFLSICENAKLFIIVDNLKHEGKYDTS
jgi:hypothetical protein